MAIEISGVNNNDKITANDGTIDLLSSSNLLGTLSAPSINVTGIVTATSFAGNISGTTGTFGDFVNVGSNIQLGNAGVATATTFVGNLTGNVNNTGNLLLQIGGSEKFRVGGSGQLGIGGANYGTSGQVLTSGGSGSAASWTTVSGTTINNNADNRIITGSGTANTLEGESTLTYDGADLNISNNTPQLILTDTNSNNSYGRVRGNGGNLILSADHANATGGVRIINFEIGGSEKARITSDNKFGVGTATPVSILHLHEAGSSGAPIIQFSNGDTGTTTGDGFAIGLADNESPFIYNRENTDIRFGVNNQERVRITKEGYVTKSAHPSFQARLINHTNATANPLVFDDVSVNVGSHYKSSGSDAGKFVVPVAGTYFFFWEAIKNSTSNVTRLYIQKNGSRLSNQMHLRLQEEGLYANGCLNVIMTLAVGDKIHIELAVGGVHASEYTHFGGYLIG